MATPPPQTLDTTKTFAQFNWDGLQVISIVNASGAGTITLTDVSGGTAAWFLPRSVAFNVAVPADARVTEGKALDSARIDPTVSLLKVQDAVEGPNASPGAVAVLLTNSAPFGGLDIL